MADLPSTASDSAKVAAASPVLIPAASYVGTRAVAQKTAIASRLPTQWYSRPISGEELKRQLGQINKLARWEYMGTKSGHHFISRTEINRRIYRVHEDEFAVESPFTLTARKSKWRQISFRPSHKVTDEQREPDPLPTHLFNNRGCRDEEPK